MKPTLKAPGTKHLILNCDEQLSNFAFNFNLCHYSMDIPRINDKHILRTLGRDLNSSTSQLNLRRLWSLCH